MTAFTLMVMYDYELVLLSKHLKSEGLLDREIADALGVSVRTVRHWRYGTRQSVPPEERVYGPTNSSCPMCTDEPLKYRPYSYLLGLYLGDGHIVSKRKQHTIAISCTDSYPVLMNQAERTLKAVLPNAGTGRVQKKGCTDVKSYSRHWTCLFPQHGPGMKHTRKIELADWQRKIVEQCPLEFIRGLIDSDGCRSMNRIKGIVAGEVVWREYPRYTFSNASDDIRRLFCWALDLVGVEWRVMNARNISVARRASVAYLDLHVGPKF